MILITLLGIIALILLITYIKLDTFISFIIVSIGLGLALGMSADKVADAIKNGIGNTLGDLILIIGFGAMLGKIVAESGAAQRITNALISIFKGKSLPWGMALAGFIIGIPLFYNAGFIIVVPLIFSIVVSTKLPVFYIAIPMLSALSVAHGFLPPHPSPSAIALGLNADISKTLLYGIIVSIPAIIIAGVLFGQRLKHIIVKVNQELLPKKQLEIHELPSLTSSLIIALLPVILLPFSALLKSIFPQNEFIALLSKPFISMLISVLVAIYFLGIRRGKNMKRISKELEDSIKTASGILLIIAGSGTLKQVLSDSGVSKFIGEQLQEIPLNPLILGWLIAGVIRVCVGSATVAGMTTVGIVAPLVLTHPEVSPELMVLAVGAGSLLLSHVNDSGFWLFKEYFQVSITETIKTWTVMETIVSVVGLLAVLGLDLLV
jgi:Gnt-I system high-affinity gluconate transporter